MNNELETDKYYKTRSGHKAYVATAAILDGTEDEYILVGTVFNIFNKEEFETVWSTDGRHSTLIDLFLDAPWYNGDCTCGSQAVKSSKHSYYCDLYE